MKILETEIALKLNTLFTVLERNEHFFNSPLHVHPEFELVYVRESFGKRIIGNGIEPFEPGDMVLIGPQLPHVWINDEMFMEGRADKRARSLILYFHPSILESGIFNLQEATAIRELLTKSGSGLSIHGVTREKVVTLMERILVAKGFEKILCLLQLLHELSGSADLIPLNAEELINHERGKEKDRLCEVYRFVNENFRTDIQLKDVSRLTNLTPQSFCRLFKKRNKIHFVEYLNQVRISNACRLLLDSDWTISEIAYNCGYKTISNFNKLFKETTGYAPKHYREVAKTGVVMDNKV
ncbi:AraC family transcriptional regulator [Flavihumibacter petaseus]|uniref:Putative AraC family transcriptional regulator n=1 Tax=Flavihumibacter petaseus NBRC 106054 TaxID=1220578 RepID=A0A0E9N2K7_9BACT|nr:AraC family transcriptional regulator [Flavihumibacter petaseus]GAO43871.1 putative AraC family transcriptional regulator [Flavihumibacter petaseus NBRC 106054]